MALTFISFSKRLYCVLLACILRHLVSVYLPDLELHCRWLVTPWASAKRLREAVFHWRRGEGSSLYDSDQFHLLPMYIHLFAPLLDYPPLCRLVWQIIDVLTAFLLSNVVHKISLASLTAQEEIAQELSQIALACYLLNPIMVCCSSVCSFACIVNVLVAAALHMALQGSFALSTLVLAFVVSCNPYYVVLVAPLSACSFSASSIENEKDESSWARAGKTVSVFLLTLGVIYAYNLLMLSPTLSAKWTVLEQTHGFFLTAPDHTPNVGLFWYFFAEMFSQYRHLFLAVFQLNVMLYLIPLTLLFRRHWLLLWLVLLIQISLFSPYPSLSDMALFLPLTLAFAHLNLRYPLFVGLAMLTSTVLMPVMYQMWVVSGTGNANFFFATITIYCAAQVFLFADLLSARLRADVVSRYTPDGGSLFAMEQRFNRLRLVDASPLLLFLQWSNNNNKPASEADAGEERPKPIAEFHSADSTAHAN